MASARPVQLRPRLQTAFSLYDRCDLAADIGTDHAHLPAALLERGLCRRMILTDISPDALNNARSEMIRRNLMDFVDLRLGNGLSPLTEACGVISVTGMGGRTIRSILLSGKDRLHDAKLILSAHTDWHLIRQSIVDIGYHIDREEPCFDAGRFYLVIRALPGAEQMSSREIRLGNMLFHSDSPYLVPFLQRRIRILSARLAGLRSASVPDKEAMTVLLSDIDYLSGQIARLSEMKEDNQ